MPAALMEHNAVGDNDQVAVYASPFELN